MTRPFSPHYGSLPVNGQYRPMFAIYEDEPLRLVFYADGPRYFETTSQARDAARKHAAALIGRMAAAEAEEEADADIFSIESWRRERAERIEGERRQVFGNGPAQTVFSGGREVPVERKGKRKVLA